jgi:hypothetical protein
MKDRLLLIAMVFTLLLTSCGQPAASPTPTEVAPTPTATTEPTPQPTKSPTPTAVANEEYLSNFEIVWQTVNDTYFDPTFGGLDWGAVHDRYRPLIAAAQDDTDRNLHDAHGLIIDLRGNPGGIGDVLAQMTGQLVAEQILLFTARTRDEVTDFALRPAESVFEGPVVILIDATCTSSSELFPGVLQEIGRAVIVGEPSPGSVTGGGVTVLPNGAFFMYPYYHIKTSKGTVLEGRGVVPDVEVELDRELLLQGVDLQLEAAIAHILSQESE